MKICHLCGKQSSRLGKHLIWCEAKHRFLSHYSLDSKSIQKEYDRLGSVLEFINAYPDIFNKNRERYYRLFKELNIDYSLNKSSKNSEQRRRETYREKTGYSHPFCKGSPDRKKWESRLLDEEGIVNVFQRESVKQKSKQTTLRKYGSLSNKGKYTQRGASVSKLNRWLYDSLRSLDIEFQPEFPLSNNGKIYYYDAAINQNQLIEVNGDYWHGNPEIYHENDIILANSSGEISVSEKWSKDKKKLNFADSLGYRVLTIWELDISRNEQMVLDRIKRYAKNGQNQVNQES